ncbi:heterokaryon incompatibility protein [Colletotrichum tabaci]|uniref:Heterokaryon incompatibility protein n=1 Tax=Colletotrichum tabaci TaxID=1209068 RepID=A0AAV9TGW1_9PEZI
MRHWMDDCVNNHLKCVRGHGSRDFVPTRILDFGPGDGLWPPAYIRIVETKKGLILALYLTLSHCWGSNSFAICTNANFTEAIHTFQRLGVQFIWIDSTCIIQG